MSDVMTAPFWIALGQILMINLVLSGDNAVVIALACRNLPPRERQIGIFGGVFGAVAARILLTVFAVSLLQLPWLKVGGALLLIWIGVQLIAEVPDAGRDIKAHERLWAAMSTIVMADVIMSLDNVIGVAAAARGDLTLLILGLAISIPIVVFGSELVLKLLERAPMLIVVGGGLLGYVAGEMAATDPALGNIVEGRAWADDVASLSCALLVVALGLGLRARHVRRAAP